MRRSNRTAAARSCSTKPMTSSISLVRIHSIGVLVGWDGWDYLEVVAFSSRTLRVRLLDRQKIAAMVTVFTSHRKAPHDDGECKLMYGVPILGLAELPTLLHFTANMTSRGNVLLVDDSLPAGRPPHRESRGTCTGGNNISSHTRKQDDRTAQHTKHPTHPLRFNCAATGATLF